MDEQLATRRFASLDGPWALAVDHDDVGCTDEWFRTPPQRPAAIAVVPSYAQEALPEVAEVLWYWRVVEGLPRPGAGDRAVLCFGAVDHAAQVWLNGCAVGSHEGGETPFRLDVTDALADRGPDLLVVRVAMATADGHTGHTLVDVAHRNRERPFRAGASWNTGGITGTVGWRLEPVVAVDELIVRAAPGASTVDVVVGLTGLGRAVDAVVRATISTGTADAADSPGSAVFASDPMAVRLDPGEPLLLPCATGILECWTLDVPRLYRVTVEVTIGDRTVVGTTRFGVRDFRLVDGRFHLNGTPLFLRMTHTVNDYPWTSDPATTLGRLRRDLVHLKTCGFDMVRFIWGDARTEQLDLCDEIGLLVYQETFASWPLRDGPALPERMGAAIADIVRRDRHHPSVVVWGLLNEAVDGGAVDHAAGMLEALARLDGTRMVALNSGRWDTRAELGSFANPGSTSWDGLLGDEGVVRRAGDERGWRPDGSFGELGRNIQAVGDVHPYPIVPHTAAVVDFLRRVGRDTGHPVFVSEYGVGSAVDLWRAARHYEVAGRADAQDASFYRDCYDRFMADWDRWSLAEVFGHPARYFEASLERMAQERALGIDALRSNPHVNGYGLTGAVDQVMCGEGLATTFRDLKPHVADLVTAAFAPVRLCCFTSAQNLYPGEEVRVEVVLSTEVDLPPGLPVTVQLYGPDGSLRWSHSAQTGRPLANARAGQVVLPVLDTTISAPDQPGSYRLRSFLEAGAPATDGTTELRVFERPTPPPGYSALVLGGDDAAELLSGCGLPAQGWQDQRAGQGNLVVWPSAQPYDEAGADRCRAALAAGANVLCLNPDVFDALVGDLPVDLPVGGAGTVPSWLYQRDDWAHRHPVFDGLPGGALLDWDCYRELVTERIYRPAPAQAIQPIAGVLRASQDYDSGLTIWSASVGDGQVFGCTYGVDVVRPRRHPVAEILLHNIARHLRRTPAGTTTGERR